MHSYILFPPFSQDKGIIFLMSQDNETSFSVAMSEEREHIDHRVAYLFNQALTQAAIALCLAITGNLHSI